MHCIFSIIIQVFVCRMILSPGEGEQESGGRPQQASGRASKRSHQLNQAASTTSSKSPKANLQQQPQLLRCEAPPCRPRCYVLQALLARLCPQPARRCTLFISPDEPKARVLHWDAINFHACKLQAFSLERTYHDAVVPVCWCQHTGTTASW